MSVKWKRGLLLGLVIFLYSLAAQNLWPNFNIYLNALTAAVLAGVTAKISESIFKEK